VVTWHIEDVELLLSVLTTRIDGTAKKGTLVMDIRKNPISEFLPILRIFKDVETDHKLERDPQGADTHDPWGYANSGGLRIIPK